MKNSKTRLHMKIKKTALMMSLIAVGLLSGSASATTYQGSDFSSMSYYSGSYNAGPPGHAALAYTGSDQAVVGVIGPLGTLNNLNMSFTYANLIGGPGNNPYAAFGISDNSTWVGGTPVHRLDVISENGNQLIGTSLVHVWDFTANGGNGGDVSGMSGVTLDSILGTYGTWEVMRAYAYIGNSGAVSGSVDINSITVTTVPDGASTALLLGLGFAGLALFGVRQNRLQMAK